MLFMFRELKLEAKIVAGGNLSGGSLSPTVDLWCLLNSGWELSGKEHLSSPLFSKHIVSRPWAIKFPIFSVRSAHWI